MPEPSRRRRRADAPWSSPARIEDDLKPLLKSLEKPGRVDASELRAAWTRVAGEGVAAGTRVLGLRDGTLKVGVASSSLLYELRGFRGRGLFERLSVELPPGRIQRLQFVPARSSFR